MKKRHKKCLRNLFFLLALNILFAFPLYSKDVTYTLYHLPKEKCLQIVLEFSGSPSGKTALNVPGIIWDTDSSEWIRKISLLTSQAELLSPTKKEPFYTISHQPHARLKVSYRVCPKQDKAQFYRPYIDSNSFYFLGAFVLVTPKGKENIPQDIVLKWRAPQKKTFFINHFGFSYGTQVIKASFQQLKDGLFMGGNFPLQCTKGKKLCIAFHGKLGVSQKFLFQTTQKIVKNQRKFFKEQENPYTFFAFIGSPNLFEEDLSGVKLSHSFGFLLPSSLKNKLKILNLISHEHLHTWFGGKIPQQPGEQEYADKWFMEGFTEYYASYLNLHFGLISSKDYVKDYNTCLKNYFTSPFNTASNEEIAKNYWTSSQLSQVVYWRGRIIAHELNQFIKDITFSRYSLEDLMIRMIERCTQQTCVFSQKILKEVFQEITGQEYPEKFNEMVNIGNINSLSPFVLAPQFKLQLKEMDVLDLGFDAKTSLIKGDVFRVDLKGKAFQAGLRNDQKLIGFFIPSNTNQQCTIDVRKGKEKEKEKEKEMRIFFFPTYKKRPIPQYE